MTTKKGSNFCPETYKRCDAPAKVALVKALEKSNCGFSIFENPDDPLGNIDLKCPDVIAEYPNGRTVLFEAEVTEGWDSSKTIDGRPNWNCFRQWHRKLEQPIYLKAMDADAGYWAHISSDLKFAVICPFDAKITGKGVFKNKRYGKTVDTKPWEVSFFLDLDNCKFLDLETGALEPFNPESL